MAQPIASSVNLIEAIRQHQLLGEPELTELSRRGFSCPRDAAREILRCSWLTPYQINQLLVGNATDLLMGPYVILERLGEGGQGQVFKARHRHMDRIVALKVLRKDLLNDREVMGRFQREIKVISQLTHPNIVLAHDAGPTGANFFLAMEHVEGTSLSELVRKHGPLTVPLATNFIRQAALGLQHIHERGLVHRDVKPANLLLTRSSSSSSSTDNAAGVVKILDLGLARLMQPVQSGATEALTTDYTGTLGTVDFMSPEQALDFHRADIRADVYSLGCTLYYLLTGSVPFGAGTVTQKLMWHQHKEPAPLDRARKDVPPSVVQALRRMMAKNPADRFQTPGEIVPALGGGPAALPVAAETVRIAPVAVRIADAPVAAVAAPSSLSGQRSAPVIALPPAPTQAAPAPEQRPGSASGRGFRLAIVAALAAVLLLVAGAAGLLFSRKKTERPLPELPAKAPPETVTVEIPDNRVDLLNFHKGQLPTDTGSSEKTYTLVDHSDLGKALRVAFRPGDSFGDRARIKDWKQFAAVQFDAVNPAKETVNFTLNVLHRYSTNYQTRVVRPFELRPGKTHVRIPLENVTNVDGSAADLANVVKWYVAVDQGKAPTIYFGDMVFEGRGPRSTTEVPSLVSPPLPIPVTTVTIQGKPAVSDVLIDSASPTRGYGKERKDNPIKKSTVPSYFLVSFDLTKHSALLRSRTIETATMTFYVWDPSSTGKTRVQAYLMLTPWDEATATWQQAAASRPWRTGGGAFDLNTNAAVLVPHQVVNPDAPGKDLEEPPLPYDIDVSATVRRWADGRYPNYGVALVGVPDRNVDQGFNTRFRIYSSESDRPQFGPKLFIRMKSP